MTDEMKLTELKKPNVLDMLIYKVMNSDGIKASLVHLYMMMSTHPIDLEIMLITLVMQ